MKEKKKPYEAPRLTVVTFKTERGYATSITKFAILGAWVWDDGESVDGVQDYTMEENEIW